MTAVDFVEAINDMLVAAFPDVTVYKNACPEDFDRPSFVIDVAQVEETPANKYLVEVNAVFVITCYSPADDYYLSDNMELARTQNKVLSLFRKRYIEVGDRKPSVSATSGGFDLGAGYVDIRTTYMLARDDPEIINIGPGGGVPPEDYDDSGDGADGKNPFARLRMGSLHINYNMED